MLCFVPVLFTGTVMTKNITMHISSMHMSQSIVTTDLMPVELADKCVKICQRIFFFVVSPVTEIDVIKTRKNNANTVHYSVYMHFFTPTPRVVKVVRAVYHT